jgi:hypothetical protein
VRQTLRADELHAGHGARHLAVCLVDLLPRRVPGSFGPLTELPQQYRQPVIAEFPAEPADQRTQSCLILRRCLRVGVTLALVKTDDKNNPEGRGQRIYLQRGAYVVEVDEWKSIYRDAAGKPVPGKQFPHTGPISPNVVVKAVTSKFPAE